MKRIIILALLTWILSSCSDNISVETNKNIFANNQVIEQQVQNKQVSNLRTVWVKEFKKEIEKKDWVLIDLRRTDEVARWVIPWTNKNIDYYAPDFVQKISSLDKNKKYLIYCRSGHRSWKTFELMKKLWFKNVINLDWGLIAWGNAWEDLWTLWEVKKEEIKINNEEKNISISEVQKHNQNSDCWTIIENKVYNLTSFFGIHPGWDWKLETLCWVDWTKDFMWKHQENAKAKNKLKEFYIWELKIN